MDPDDARREDDNPPVQENANNPEIVDGEVVGSTSGDNAPVHAEVGVAASDAAAFQQFRQFQQFQQFQEWQRQHGEAKPGANPAARPWWKLALLPLRYKAVRGLLYFVVALVLIYTLFVTAINHFLGGTPHDNAQGKSVPGNQNPAVSPAQGAFPQDAVKGLYSSIATNNPAAACAEFTPQAGMEFAVAVGATDCTTAVQRLSNQVADATAYTDNAFLAFQSNSYAVTTSNGQADVPACSFVVQGGPHLGTFHLQQLPNRGWRIDGYQSPPAQCPSS